MLAAAFSAFLSCLNALGLVVVIFLMIFPVLFFVGWSKTGRMPELLPALGAFLLGRLAYVLMGVLLFVVVGIALSVLAMFGLITPLEDLRASAASSVGIMWGVAVAAMVLGLFHLLMASRVVGWIYNHLCIREEGFEVAMLEFGVPFGILMTLMLMGLMVVTITGVPASPSQSSQVASSQSAGGSPSGSPGGIGPSFSGQGAPEGSGGDLPNNSGSRFPSGPGGGTPGGFPGPRNGNSPLPGEGIPDDPGATMPQESPGNMFPGGLGSGIPGGPVETMPGELPGGRFPGIPGSGVPGRPGNGFPGGFGGGFGGGFSGNSGGISRQTDNTSGFPGNSRAPRLFGGDNLGTVPDSLLGKASYLLRRGNAKDAWDYAWAAYLLEEKPELKTAVKWCNALNRPVLGTPRLGVVVVNLTGTRLGGVSNQTGSPLGPLATALPEVALVLTEVANQLGSPLAETPWLAYLGTSFGSSHANTLARQHRVDLIISVILVRKRRGRRYDLQVQFQLNQPGKPQPVWKSETVSSTEYRRSLVQGTDLLQQVGQKLLAELRRGYPLVDRPAFSGSEATAYVERVLNSLGISAIEKAALVKYLAQQGVLSPEQATKAAQQVTITQIDVTKPNPSLKQWVQARLPIVY